MTIKHTFTLQWLEGMMLDGGPTRKVLAYNGQIPGPTIEICEGDSLEVTVINGLNGTLPEDAEDITTLHFHGIRQLGTPWADGVPWVTQYPIGPGESFTHEFDAYDYKGAPPGTYSQTGTFWYHSHVGSQRANGAYGALIIRSNSPKKNKRYDDDPSENVMILQEWYDSPNVKIRKLQSILIDGTGRKNKDSSTNYKEYEVTKLNE